MVQSMCLVQPGQGLANLWFFCFFWVSPMVLPCFLRCSFDFFGFFGFPQGIHHPFIPSLTQTVLLLSVALHLVTQMDFAGFSCFWHRSSQVLLGFVQFVFRFWTHTIVDHGHSLGPKPETQKNKNCKQNLRTAVPKT